MKSHPERIDDHAAVEVRAGGFSTDFAALGFKRRDVGGEVFTFKFKEHHADAGFLFGLAAV